MLRSVRFLTEKKKRKDTDVRPSARLDTQLFFAIQFLVLAWPLTVNLSICQLVTAVARIGKKKMVIVDEGIEWKRTARKKKCVQRNSGS